MLSLVSRPFLIAVTILIILAVLQSDMTDEDIRDGKRRYSRFLFFLIFFLFIHLFRLRSWRIKLYEWHSQRGPRASCQSLYPLLSPLFHTVMQFLTSVSYCLPLCTNEVEKGDYSNKKAEGFLAAYLTRVASDLLRRLYHALCGTVQAALTTLHIVSDSGLFPRGRR